MNGTTLHQTSDSERKVTSDKDAHYMKVTSKMYNFYLIDVYIFKWQGFHNLYATLFYFE